MLLQVASASREEPARCSTRASGEISLGGARRRRSQTRRTVRGLAIGERAAGRSSTAVSTTARWVHDSGATGSSLARNRAAATSRTSEPQLEQDGARSMGRRTSFVWSGCPLSSLAGPWSTGGPVVLGALEGSTGRVGVGGQVSVARGLKTTRSVDPLDPSVDTSTPTRRPCSPPSLPGPAVGQQLEVTVSFASAFHFKLQLQAERRGSNLRTTRWPASRRGRAAPPPLSSPSRLRGRQRRSSAARPGSPGCSKSPPRSLRACPDPLCVRTSTPPTLTRRPGAPCSSRAAAPLPCSSVELLAT